ncbi:MAG: ABC transporter permease [Planctomycetota bacterium]
MRSRLSKTLVYRWFFLLVGNALLFAWMSSLMTAENSHAQMLSSVGRHLGPTLLAAIGMTGVIASGSIDLSVGAIVAVAGTVFGVLVHYEMPPLLCFAACLAVAWLLAYWNAWLVRLLKLPAIIITLAGLTFYRGLALVIADMSIENFSGNISIQKDAYHAPGLEYANSIVIVSCVAALIFVSRTKTARTWLALGDSPEALRLAGISPNAVSTSAFSFAGVFLGLAAVLVSTQVQAIEPARLSLGFELGVIGAVVLGGTNIFGGEASWFGTLLGALFLFLLSQVLVYAGVSPYFRDVVSGGAILFVIGLDCFLHKKRKLAEELR